MDAKLAVDPRLELLERWVREDLGFQEALIEPASADASFRRYFRITRARESFIVMDAPPDKEDLAPYIAVTRLLADIGLNVPWVLARNEPQGLLLLTDLGTRLYLPELTSLSSAASLYADALGALAHLQTAGRPLARALAPYDEALLRREMQLLPEWFLGRHLGMTPDPGTEGLLQRLFDALTQAALSQPQTFVHRDFHSRNLLITPANSPGIIDFQDAVQGPVTYDLVSLLKDCYVAWPAEVVREWALQYRERLLQSGFALELGAAQFLRAFDLMGLQRHVKVLGIFCRLYYRDGKAHYLADLPRVLDYACASAGAHPETAEFSAFLEQRVRPAFAAAQARAGARASA